MSARDEIYSFIKKELIGPSCEFLDSDGEEILISDRPEKRYISGILFPQKQKLEQDDVEQGSIAEELINDEHNSVYKNDHGFEFDLPSDLSDESEECLNLSNAFKQSAISLTVATNSTSGIDIDVSCAKYKQIPLENINGHNTGFKRIPIKYQLKGINYKMPKNSIPIVKKIEHNGETTDLELHIFYRYSRHNIDVYTVSLVNIAEAENLFNTSLDELFFQAEIKISSKNLVPIPASQKILQDEDYKNNKLLYRTEQKYAIGHGCSPLWVSNEEMITITSSFLPTYKINTIVSNKIDNVRFSMYDFFKKDDKDILQNLRSLVFSYDEWIKEQEKIAKTLESDYPIAFENIKKCLECCKRIESGIQILENNPLAMKAFRYMNKAMLMQQLHYHIKKKDWDKNNSSILLNEGPLPNIEDINTWGEVKGEWRLFQIAFILLNIKSIVDENCDERKNVELIWFPTGGGKTEAYLGLSAFVIFYRRLINHNDKGTDIIMRYTLRLLTAQQYERASALICSAEYIRAQNSGELGNNRITIGLWVGSQTTPNKGEDACNELDKLQKGKITQNPFLITKCPWCGASMGPILSNKKSQIIKGYFPTRSKVTGKNMFTYMCSNQNCYFSSLTNPLPLQIVDEQIYEEPPTIVIGTVDKFANLPFIPKSKAIFGIENGQRIKGVSLIIQDELHLISGPLGSTVSLYETLIDYLSTDNRNENNPIAPKIVASTATISMAKQQCKNLFARKEDQIKIFPPSCINYGETFFATKKNDETGRQYVGVYAPASSSQATTAINLISALLQIGARLDANWKDAYWTNVVYFNSLRELGTAATWISADISEHCKTICKRMNDGIKRLPYNSAELTSRIDSREISKYLDELSITVSNENKKAIDICLATNMISVGLDISRLGLMTVAGQPKTTSEYIQTTSRVGRGKSPGIIFTLYNPNKPRDKSIFENFEDYHSKMYTYVEPTSVTPYSPPLRSRALAAVFFGIIRLGFCMSDSEKPDAILLTKPEVIEKVKNIILERVLFVDPSEYDNTKQQIDSIINKWKNNRYQRYSPDFGNFGSNIIPSIYSSSDDDENYDGKSNQVPSSMRTVDKNCRVEVKQ